MMRELIKGLRIITVSPGEHIWKAGTSASRACFILEGEVELITPNYPLEVESESLDESLEEAQARKEKQDEARATALRLGLPLAPRKGSLEAAKGRFGTWAGLQMTIYELEVHLRKARSVSLTLTLTLIGGSSA